jgi:hypothetical protein
MVTKTLFTLETEVRRDSVMVGATRWIQSGHCCIAAQAVFTSDMADMAFFDVISCAFCMGMQVYICIYNTQKKPKRYVECGRQEGAKELGIRD